MNEKEQQEYLEKYKREKEHGMPFFPDAIFKDALVSLLVFVVLIALSYFIGAPLEARANPADTSYTPRPEWYFLFLFQLLKYFPGNLEVVGVVVIPTIAIIALFLLPLLDRSSRRHFTSRPVVSAITLVGMIGVIFLSIQSYRETPPPAEAAPGDATAALYTKNCAGCHGPSISVTPGENLHEIIAQGRHEGMPAWSADLTSDQIDALAGFILSPSGSQLFTDTCGECHVVDELVAGNPIQLKSAIENGTSYAPHADVDLPEWKDVLDSSSRTALLNFLIAPDGQRLFTVNCASCHGRSVSYSGDENELREIIRQGGLHLEMPPWQGTLNSADLDILAAFTVNPETAPGGQQLFEQYCSNCHGERVPIQTEVEQAKQTLREGGAHQEMPVWGNILTDEQLNALVSFTISQAEGTSIEVGQELFASNCAPCHGDFGEGGLNPTRPNDIIAPISTAEYLKTRDDFTLRAVISQGQPNFGMSPFGSSFGGPLSDEDIDAIVGYMRSWEANPPVELPPEITSEQISIDGPDIYAELCAQCHGPNGEGDIGPALNDPQFQTSKSDQDLYDSINLGHEASAMISWGAILSAEQIQELVNFIRQLEPPAAQPTATAPAAAGPTPTASPASFSNDILPLFEARCAACHGSFGGWDASSYDAVMTTGNNAPVVIPGEAANSLLAQKMLGTHTAGTIMPPSGKLADVEVQLVVDWINAGAPDN